MGKRVVIVSSSFRKGGNSERLAKEFAKGVIETENTVEIIYLRDLEINFCKGCLACQKTGKCMIKDETSEVMEIIKDADVLVFATPIYYYAMAGQLKTFLDRMNPIFAVGHHFKEVYLLTSAADEEETAMEGAIKEINGWISCFDGVELAGIVKGTASTDIGDIQKHADKLQEAYQMGKDV